MTPRRGLTLMELMVALALTGLVATVGGAAFATMIDHREVMRRAAEETERAAALRSAMHDWIAAGIIIDQTGGVPGSGGGPGAAASRGERAELPLLTWAPTPAMTPTARIRLFVDDDPSTPETGLTLAVLMRQDRPERAFELEPRVRSLQVEYLDRRVGRWMAAGELPAAQARAVRVTLGGAEGDSLPPLLRLPLVSDLGQDAPAGTSRGTRQP